MTQYQEGIYKAKASAWGWTTTTTGKPQFLMEFRVLGTHDRNDSINPARPFFQGARSWSICPTTANSEAWLIRVLKHLGYNRDDASGLDPEAADAHDFTGVDFLVRCKHTEYNGSVREQWSVYEPPAARPKLEKKMLDAVKARLSGKFKEVKAANAEEQAGADSKGLPY